jgi:hypothetical protein
MKIPTLVGCYKHHLQGNHKCYRKRRYLQQLRTESVPGSPRERIVRGPACRPWHQLSLAEAISTPHEFGARRIYEFVSPNKDHSGRFLEDELSISFTMGCKKQAQANSSEGDFVAFCHGLSHKDSQRRASAGSVESSAAGTRPILFIKDVGAVDSLRSQCAIQNR